MAERSRAKVMSFEWPSGNDPDSVRQRIEAMERLLESSFSVPGTNYRFGLDAVVGLVPVLGDAVTMGLAAYLVWEASNLGMPKWKLVRMAGNIGFDALIGAVPVVGDAADFFFKSNTRNLRIVKAHLDKHHPHTRVIEQ